MRLFSRAAGALTSQWFAALMLTAALATPVHAQPSGFEGYSRAAREQGSAAGQPVVTTQHLPPMLEDIAFDQRVGEKIPGGLVFRDESGQEVRLESYTARKPIVLAFVYYACPMLCSQVLEGLTSSLKVVPFLPGKEFDVVVVSFDPKDTPERAAARKAMTVARYGREETAAGWHFLTGDEKAVRALTDAAGFRYAWDAKGNQFAHASGIVVVNPGGEFHRYFYGVTYPPKDVRLALIDAGEGKVGSIADQVLLFCYHYDPALGKYTAFTLGLLRLGGIATLLVLFGGLFVMIRQERRRPVTGRRGNPPPAPAGGVR